MSTEFLNAAGVVLLAVILDVVFGEPKRWHPLVGFGHLAQGIEKKLNRSGFSKFFPFFFGIIAWALLVVLPTIIIVVGLDSFSKKLGAIKLFNDWLLEWPFVIEMWLEAIVLYFTIAYTSLRQHALAVLSPLLSNNIEQSRQQVAMMVSRDTESLDKAGIRKATIESVLENGSDAIFAPIFWFMIGGIPAVLIYRFTNTLDAMWGYKTERFLFFGRFTARMDDILNWLPSRLVGLSYSLLGNTKQAIQCWQQQAHLLESPNGGVVMTAGAGALSLKLGGDCVYHDFVKSKPIFGCGALPKNYDIQRSLTLVSHTLLLWCVVISGATILLALKGWFGA